MTSNDWEDKCNRCGKCCHDKLLTKDGMVVNTGKLCRWQDPVTQQCTVYDKRFVVEPRCVKITLENVATLCPNDCGYRHKKSILDFTQVG